MTTPKASGPLWADNPFPDGELDAWRCGPIKYANGDQHPCRLIPGHGKVVPMELVEAIVRYYAIDDWQMVGAAIDAAVKGAV